jgi:diadenosine tetraphosphate (Ap4A) HIT family hydrolase
VDDVEGCLACDLRAGRLPLPGGRVHETEHWIVEHCVGPLGVGTLLVKPRRHVVAVGELSAGEAAELGPLLARTAAVVDELVRPEQVYVGLWSHAGRTRVHIHFVVQPATTEAIEAVGDYGPGLPAGMFAAGELPDPAAMQAFSDRARVAFGAV